MYNKLFKSILFVTLFFLSSSLYADDYYWIGNSGNWSDLSHWATSSGNAVVHTTLPTAADNVFFDGNSFDNVDEVVSIDQRIIVNNFDASTVNQPMSFSSTIRGIDINGSFEVNDQVLFNIDFMILNLLSDNLFNTIAIEKGFLNTDKNSDMSFSGAGAWELMTNYEGRFITLSEGTLTTGANTVTAFEFVTDGFNQKDLMIDQTTWIVDNWKIFSDLNSFSAVNSSISVERQFDGDDLSYHKIIVRTPDSGSFSDFLNFNGDNIIDSLVFQQGTEVLFQIGSNNSILNAIQVLGTFGNKVLLQTNGDGTAAISGAGISIVGDYPVIENVSFTGTATFNLTNGLLLENSSGWEVLNVSTPTGSGSFYFSKVYADSAFVFAGARDGNERLVFMKEGGAFADVNINQNTFYTANQTFGTGSNVGTDTYLVYQGAEGEFKVDGLTPGVQYAIAIVEANVNHDRTVISYDKLSATFSKSTTTPASTDVIMTDGSRTISDEVEFYDDGGNGFYISEKNNTFTFTASNSAKSIELSFEFLDLNSDNDLRIFDGADTTSVLIATLSGGSHTLPLAYISTGNALTVNFKSDQFSLSEFNSKGWRAKVNEVIAIPTVASGNARNTGKTNNSVSFDIDKGNGDGRLIIANTGNSITTYFPIDDSVYLADPELGLGTDLGLGRFVVGFGDITTQEVTNIGENSMVGLQVYEYNRVGDEVRYATNPYIFSLTNANETPTIPTSNGQVLSKGSDSVAFSFNKGNGNGRLIIAVSNGFLGSFIPLNDSIYEASSVFGIGAQLADDTYVIGSGDLSSLNLTGLTPNTNYSIIIFEYNQLGDEVLYFNNRYSINIDTNIDVPTLLSSNPQFTKRSFSEVGLKFTPGNGDGRMVLVGSQSSFVPNFEDRDYEIDEEVGNGFTVKAFGDIDSLLIAGLPSAANYYYAIVEFNEQSGAYGYSEPFVVEYDHSIAAPTIPSSEFQVDAVGDNTIDFRFKPGDGAGRVVLLIEGNEISTFFPGNDISYYGSVQGAFFGAEPDRTYIIGAGIDSTFKISGLKDTADYTVTVYEFNQDSTDITYSSTPFTFPISTKVVDPPMELTEPFSMSFDRISLLKNDEINIGAFITNPYEEVSALWIASETPINESNLTNTFIEDFRVTVNDQFGQGMEVGDGLFPIAVSRVDPGYNFETVNVQNLKSSTAYYLAVILMNENSAGVRYGIKGAVTTKFITREEKALFLGDLDTLVAEPLFLYSSNGFVRSQNFSNTTNIYYPANSGDKLAFKFSDMRLVSSDSLIVYDGLPLPDNELRTFVENFNLQADTIPLLKATNEEGILSFRKYSTSTSSSTPIGLKGRIYPVSDDLSEKPTATLSLQLNMVTKTTATVNWKRGNGEKRALVINPDGTKDFNFLEGFDITTPDADLDGRRVIVIDNIASDTLVIDGLVADRKYSLQAVEINGSGSNVNYSTPTILDFQTISNRPTQQAVGLDFRIVDSTSIKLFWENGNGERRMVISTIQNSPDNFYQLFDGQEFNANPSYINSPEVKIDNFTFKVLYDGSGDEVIVTDFESQSTTRYYVLEYNGNGTVRNYQVSTDRRFGLQPASPVYGIESIEIDTVTAASATLKWDVGIRVFEESLMLYLSTVDEEIPFEDGLLDRTLLGKQVNNGTIYLNGIHDTQRIFSSLNPEESYFVKAYRVRSVGNYFTLNRDSVETVEFNTNAFQKYFWVGGSGDWTDLSHWATTSGGDVKHTFPLNEESIAILDGNSHEGADETVIYSKVSDVFSVRKLENEGLLRKTILTKDSLNTRSSRMDFREEFKNSDSLTIDFNYYNILASNEGYSIDFKSFKSNSSTEIRFSGTAKGAKFEVVNFPPNIETMGVFESTVSFLDQSGNFNSDNLTIYNSNSGLDPFEGTVAIKDVERIFTFGNPFIPSITSTTYTDLEIRGDVEIGRLRMDSNDLSISNGVTLTTNEFSKQTGKLLRIFTDIDGPPSFIKSSADTIRLLNLEIANNHAVGSTKFIAERSVFYQDVEGWISEREKALPVPRNVYIPVVSYGDSTIIKGLLDDRNLERVYETLLVIEKGSDLTINPESNKLYKQANGLQTADRIGNSWVFNIGFDQEFEIKDLDPDTDYTIGIFTFSRRENKVVYSNFPFGKQFTTAKTSDAFIKQGQVDDIIADGKKIYTPLGIGTDDGLNLYGLEFKLFPTSTNMNAALNINNLGSRQSSISIYNGDSIDAPLIKKVELANFNFADRELIIADNPQGVLTVKIDFSGGFTSDNFLNFSTSSILKNKAEEPSQNAQNLSVKRNLGNKIILEWEKAEGSKTILLATQFGSINSGEPKDFFSYHADEEFSKGDVIQSNFVVYKGDSTSAEISGLNSETDYFFTAYAFNESEELAPNYLIADSSTFSIRTTFGRPLLRSSIGIRSIIRSDSEVRFNFIKQNTKNLMLLINKNNPVTSKPEDNIQYNDDPEGIGADGDVLSDGSQVVYVSNSTRTNLGYFNSKFEEATTYYYSIHALDQNGNSNILYSEEAFSGSFRVKNGSFKIENLPDRTVCADEENFSFNYEYTGGNFKGQKARPVLSLFEDLSDSTVLEVIDSANFNMTVRMPENLPLDQYYIALIPEEGDFDLHPYLIEVDRPEKPLIFRDKLILTTNEEGSIQWYLNGEVIQDETAQSLQVNTNGEYQVRKIFANCEVSSETILVLPRILFVEEDVPYEVCAGATAEIPFENFGEISGDITALFASVTDSLYDDNLTINSIDVSSSTISLTFSEDLDEGQYYILLEDKISGLDTKPFLIDVSNSIEKPVIIQDGQELTSSATEDNQWYRNGNRLQGATNQSFVVTKSGDYFVEVTNGNCTFRSLPVTLEITGVSVDITSELAEIYPVPTHNLLSVKLAESVVGEVRISILGLDGRMIEELYFVVHSDKEVVFDLSDYKNGIYLLQIENDGKLIVSRISKL